MVFAWTFSWEGIKSRFVYCQSIFLKIGGKNFVQYNNENKFLTYS